MLGSASVCRQQCTMPCMHFMAHVQLGVWWSQQQQLWAKVKVQGTHDSSSGSSSSIKRWQCIGDVALAPLNCAGWRRRLLAWQSWAWISTQQMTWGESLARSNRTGSAHTKANTHMHAYAHTHGHACIQTITRARTHTLTHSHTHTLTVTHSHTHTLTHTLTHSHSHTYTLSVP